MNTILYFVRHGEVENPTDILYGRLLRYGLSENGIKQIKETAEFFKNKNINKIYTSPLLRARQTANIIALENEMVVGKSKHLIEIKTSLQGKKTKDLAKHGFNFYDQMIRQETDETIEDVLARMNRFMNYIHKTHKGHRVVAVSHGDPIMIIYASLMNLPMKISSLRGNEYVRQGEVFKVTITDNNTYIEKVFKPKNKTLD